MSVALKQTSEKAALDRVGPVEEILGKGYEALYDLQKAFRESKLEGFCGDIEDIMASTRSSVHKLQAVYHRANQVRLELERRARKGGG